MPVNVKDYLREKHKAGAGYNILTRASRMGAGPGVAPSTSFQPSTVSKQIEAQKYPSGKIFSGGLVSDIGDVLNIPQYAATGIATGTPVGEAVSKRLSPSDVLEERGILPEEGLGRIGGGLAADIALDPLNIIPGLGLVGKGITKVGAATDASRLIKAGADVTEFVSKAKLPKLIKPVISKAADILGPVIKPSVTSAVAKLAKVDEAALATKSIKELTEIGISRVPIANLVLSVPEGVKAQRAAMKGAEAVGTRRAQEIAESLFKGYSKTQQTILKQSMKGGLVNWGTVASKYGDDVARRMESVVGVARRSLDGLSSEMADEFMELAKATTDTRLATGYEKLAKVYRENIGTYLTTQYIDFMDDPGKFFASVSGGEGKLSTKLFAKRRDIPEAVRSAWREVTGAAYPTGFAVQELTSNIARSKFIRHLSDNYATLEGTIQNVTKIPSNISYGSLAGKYLPDNIARLVKRTLGPAKTGDLAVIEKSYKKALSLWKEGKVILNPATQARNVFSNMVLMDLGGYPIFSKGGVTNFVDAIKEMSEQGKYYKEALSSGLIDSTYVAAEIKNFAPELLDATKKSDNLLQIAMSPINSIRKTARNAYRNSEETAKMAMFIYRRKAGDTALEAARHTNKWLFDYSDIPDAVRALRDAPFGYPFLTFTYKALPRFGEAVLTKPTAVSKYYKAFKNIEAGGDVTEQEKALLPDYMKKGMYVRMPFKMPIKDKAGKTVSKPVYLDLNYILPWGSLGEGLGMFDAGQNPAQNLLIAISLNKDPFTGNELWKDTDTDNEKAIKVVNHIYRTLFPSLMPGSVGRSGIQGGYSWNKMISAIAGKPDYKGRIRNIPTTLMDIFFGLKLQPLDVTDAQRTMSARNKAMMNEIKGNTRNIIRDQSLSESEKKRLLKIEREKMEALLKEVSVSGPNLQPR